MNLLALVSPFSSWFYNLVVCLINHITHLLLLKLPSAHARQQFNLFLVYDLF